MDRLKMTSTDKVQNNIGKIRALFPNAVTEVRRNGKVELKVDFDVLKQELADELIDQRELRYQFTWPDKQKSVLRANTPADNALRPCREESVDFDNTENVYIEGNNLKVLKLLQETYLGKIKLIYIDPPYNTGNDFIYNDDFSIEKGEYLENSGQFDEDGNNTTKSLMDNLSRNFETNGRYHTDWLNMIYPRLKLAKDLLSDDGAIFISIDENELLNLSNVADDVFGYPNRVGILSVINNLKGRSDDKFFATCNEFLLVYAKNKNALTISGFEVDEEEIESDYDKKDDIGNYKLIGFRKTGNAWEREARPYMFYPVLYKDGNFGTIPDGEFSKIYNSDSFDDEYCGYLDKKYTAEGYKVLWPRTENGEYGRWRWGRETFFQQKDINLELNNSDTLCTKMRATFEDGSIRLKSAKTLWYKPEYDTGGSSKILRTLLKSSKNLFDNPKSIAFIKDIVKVATDKNSLVLDFFSGSATCAHAVMQLNAEDGGERKFIMVQLPEPCANKSDAYKAGYKNICEIGKERIRRAGEKIKKERGKDIDAGFRVFKLDFSNMQSVYYHPEEYSQTMLDGLTDNIKPDRTPFDLLFQVMLELGIPLSAKIQEKEIAGKKVFIVNGDNLIACFDSNVTEETVKAIARLKPLYAVFRDGSFEYDCTAVNFDQIFEAYSPNTKRKVL